MNRTRVAACTVALCAATSTLSAGPAVAASPPPSWTNERILSCDGTTVTAYLTPAGFGSAFHVVGSTDVIKPKQVEVIFPNDPTEERVVTFDVPGFDRNGQATVHCSYEDPLGLVVFFDGVRT